MGGAIAPPRYATASEQNCPKNKKLAPNLLANEGIMYDTTLTDAAKLLRN